MNTINYVILTVLIGFIPGYLLGLRNQRRLSQRRIDHLHEHVKFLLDQIRRNGQMMHKWASELEAVKKELRP